MVTSPEHEETSVAGPELSVVVLAWDQVHHTRACVESIRAHTDADYELILVDNGSGEEGRAYAARAADIAILNDRNLGYSGGMNAGLDAARAPAIAFVNNDTVLPCGWASSLLSTLWSDDDVGIVAAAVTAARNRRSVQSTPGTTTEVLNPFEEVPAAVVWVMRTAVARALHGFDLRYFPAAGEDLDLAFKVWVNDLDVVLDRRVLVEHVGKGTAAAQLPNWRATWRANGDRFIRRWVDIPEDVPRLHHVEAHRFERNLRVAAAAAGWMQRYFAARERHFVGKELAETTLAGMTRKWRRLTATQTH